ncbi:MAG: CbiX/SirB N-terminal domain-containing protein [Gemmatimonadaceae bacterium]
MRAILLIDHGSIRAEANRMIECMGSLVQHMAGDAAIVRVAHMELAEPTIAQGFESCVEAGASEVVAFPYMLSPGKHSTRDIPRMVAEAAAAHPGVRFVVTPAFGVNARLAEVVLDRAGIAARVASTAPGCCMRPSDSPPRYCGEGCREVADALVGAGTVDD